MSSSRHRLALAAVAVLVAAAGCPEREELIDNVGGAPKAQVDQAKNRLEAAEKKLDRNAAEAAAATE